jgi:serine/threonine protein kinase
MALESLTDWVFTTQSDVWSFGVVLWELFSLSAVPYPMFKRVDQLIRYLKTGYRMPRAFYASNDLHWLMTQCWHRDPKQRPTFRYLEETIRGQLQFTPSLPSD